MEYNANPATSRRAYMQANMGDSDLCPADFLPPEVAASYLSLGYKPMVKPVPIHASEMDQCIYTEHAMAVNQ